MKLSTLIRLLQALDTAVGQDATVTIEISEYDGNDLVTHSHNVSCVSVHADEDGIGVVIS